MLFKAKAKLQTRKNRFKENKQTKKNLSGFTVVVFMQIEKTIKNLRYSMQQHPHRHVPKSEGHKGKNKQMGHHQNKKLLYGYRKQH